MRYISFRKPKLKTWQVVISLLTAVVILGVTVGHIWYNQNLEPVNLISDERLAFVVEPGSGVAEIAQKLQQEGLIKDSRAFVWYVRGDKAGVSLQAGQYSLSPSMGVKIIVSILSSGHIQTNQVTILPGKRLDETRQQLIDAGWTADEVNLALAGDYSDHPMLVDKPARASLEGYIFPDTYRVDSSTSAADLIRRALDNFYSKIEERNLKSRLLDRGFNLHQGISLASIVEKESGNESDKPTIAQVFLTRLDREMRLEADPTFEYAAAISGETAWRGIDSPYNTYQHSGLPPGPISNFNISTLVAVVEPSSTSYLFFVGEDNSNITHFSHTLEEHQRLTAEYCKEKCR